MTDFRTVGPWGAGTGANLTATQVDYNFYNHDLRLNTLEETVGSGGVVQIEDFEVVGNQFFVHMTDSTTFGPFQLPALEIVPRGPWEPETHYDINDIITANGSVYWVIYNHTSGGTFDPEANDGLGHNFYFLIFEQPENSLPSGGETGQVLKKLNDNNYVVTWGDVLELPAGGDDGQILIKHSDNDGDATWTDIADVISEQEIALTDLFDYGGETVPTTGDVLVWTGLYWENQSISRVTTSFTYSSPTHNPIIGDESTFYMYTFSGTVTVTLPTAATSNFPIDTELTFCCDGPATVVNVVGAVGVTLEKPDGYLTQLLGRGAVATAKKVGANRWKLFGLLAPDV